MEFEKLTAKNNAKIYVFPHHHFPSGKPIVAAGVLVGVGTVDEVWPGEAGLAHATEHEVHQGTELFPNSLALNAYLEDIGGYTNAWTNMETTFYYTKFPRTSKNTRRAFTVLSEKLLKPVFPQEKVQVEIKNIIEEIHRLHDDPQSLAYVTFLNHIYGNHPLSKEILGLEESLRAFTRETFIDFVKRYYYPSNFVYIVAGAEEPYEVFSLVNEFFPEDPTRLPLARPEVPLMPQPQEIVITRDIEQMLICLGVPTKGARDRSSIALSLFSVMIDGGSSFPLFQEIRDKRGLAYEIDAGLQRWANAGSFYVYLGTNPSHAKEAISLTHDVLQTNKTNAALLERAKIMTRGQLAMRNESIEHIIHSAAEDIAVWGAPRTLEEIEHMIDSVTIQEVEAAVNQYLQPSQFTVVKVGPQNKKSFSFKLRKFLKV